MLDWYIYETMGRHAERVREGERRYWIRQALSGAEPQMPGTLARLERWLGAYLVALGRDLQRRSDVERPAPASHGTPVPGIRVAAPQGTGFTLTGPAGDTMVQM